MNQGKKYPKIDRVIELFRERKLYNKIKSPAAFCIELILQTGATPIDLVNIKPTHFNKNKKQLNLHINKKKTIATTTHKISAKAIETFFELEKIKPISTYSIRRIQQLIKEETEAIGSELTNPRSLRKEYLKQIFLENPENIQQATQLTSIKQRKTLSKKEEKIILKSKYNKRNKLLITTLLQTGIRINELLQLQAKHIDKKTIIITKDIAYNKRKRRVPLSLFYLTNLRQVSKQKYLFSNYQNKPLTQRRFEQICKETEKKLGIKELSPSIIRATAIQNLSTKLTQEELQKQTGLQSNTLYTHALISSSTTTTTTTAKTVEKIKVERKDDDANNASRYMYSKSKLKDGGDTDE